MQYANNLTEEELSDFESVTSQAPELLAKSQEHQDKNWLSNRLQLRLVTPMYGGGTRAGQTDLLLPIRPRAVRNAIKHWWWLLNRHRFNSSADLYREMSAIWGAPSDTENANPKEAQGAVRIHVDRGMVHPKDEIVYFAPYKIHKSGIGLQLDVGGGSKNLFSYSLFSAFGKPSKNYQGNTERPPKASEFWSHPKMQQFLKYFDPANDGIPPSPLLKAGFTFNVTIQTSQRLSDVQRASVKDALNAWLHYGGLGARTNRGLGKLELLKQSADSKEHALRVTETWLIDLNNANGSLKTKSFLKSIGTAQDDAGQTVLLTAWAADTAEKAIGLLLKSFRDYRQARKAPKRGDNRPHRSFWPDADSVRTLLNTHKEGHEPQHSAIDIKQGLKPFTKPYFGAPVLIDFGKEGEEAKEPKKGELCFAADDKNEAFERFASPLVFTFVRAKDVNGNGPVMNVPALVILPYRSDLTGKSLRWTAVDDKSEPARTLTPKEFWPEQPTDFKKVFRDASDKKRSETESQDNQKLAESLAQAATDKAVDPIQHFVQWLILEAKQA
jgi:CRISPR-associated protein Cmr1